MRRGVDATALLDTGFMRSALICDALDSLGLRHQALAADILPLDPDTRVCGPAFTARTDEVDAIPDTPYEGLLRALNAVKAGEVFVLAAARTTAAAVWGELLSSACQARGVLGTVTDGFTRDAQQVRLLGYPVVSRGTLPLDTHGRCEVTELAVPVEIDGVRIEPGDLIVADVDGVAVVPAAVAAEVVEHAAAKARGEDRFREAVAGGMSATDAYNRFGVL